MLQKINCPSPNFEPRSVNAPLDLIVLHYTDMLNAAEALERLCDPQAKVSAHFLIDKEGVLYQMVDPVQCAWHAGVSSWQGKESTNHRSLGIELDNFGHTFGPEPFPPPQINTLVELLGHLTATYGIAPHRVVGHSDVAPLRKKDPGELFPWAHIAEKGFGLWPLNGELTPLLSPVSPMTVLEVQQAFSQIGYMCPQTGVWDENTQKVCYAFQRHFTPFELTGHSSHKTCEALQVLLKMNLS